MYKKIPFASKVYIALFIFLYIFNLLSKGELVKNLSIINIFGSSWMEWYRLLTCLFCHSNLLHLSANICALIFAGILLKETTCAKVYPFLFLIGGILAEFTQCFLYVFVFHWTVNGIGASSACFSLLGCLFVLHCSKNSAFCIRPGTMAVNYLLGYAILGNLFGVSTFISHILGFIYGIVLTEILEKYKSSID